MEPRSFSQTSASSCPAGADRARRPERRRQVDPAPTPRGLEEPARVDKVEKPYEPRELQLSLASAVRSGDVVAPLENAVPSAARSRLARSTSRSARVTVSQSPGGTEAGRRPSSMLCSAASRSPPAAVGSARASCSANSSRDRAALSGPQPVLEIFDDFEEGTAPNAPREVRARRRGRPTRCLVALTRRAHPRRSRAPDRAASTASSSTSPPTTWTSRRSRSSSTRSRRTTAPSCS
jgi:hypothetical protein